jgi:hypothetical protein
MKQATFRPESATDGPPSYRERAGQTVTVIDEVGADVDPDAESEDVAPMFRVRFDDGIETEAFADELDPSPTESGQ